MTVESLGRPNHFPGELAEIEVDSAAGLPWQVMVTRDFSFRTLSITPGHVAMNCVTVMSKANEEPGDGHFSKR